MRYELTELQKRRRDCLRMGMNRVLKAITAVGGLFTISMYSMKRQNAMPTDCVEISSHTRKVVLLNYRSRH